MIEITEQEMKRLKIMTKKFNDHKHRVSNQAPIHNEFEKRFLGFSGELGVHKYFDIPYQFEFDRKYRKDDINLHYKGHLLMCDVKTSRDGVLRVPYFNAFPEESEYQWKREMIQPQVLIVAQVYDEMFEWDGVDILGIISMKRFRNVAKEFQYFGKRYLRMVDGLQKYEIQSIDLLTK